MDTGADILEKVERTITRHGMTSRGDGVLVGLSGGADSVCLLHVLHRLSGRLGIRLVAAHFNHGLRPDEDAEETRFTGDLAESLRVPFTAGHWRREQPRAGGSLEERARVARYGFLSRKGKLHGCRRIALGHTLNDQAETVLMRFLRGSGAAGLSGIPPCREDGIIRPLIEIERGQVEAYLAQYGLSFVTDSSNFECRHLRNRIRIELLPLLEQYQPRIIRHLGEMAAVMREDESWMAGTAAEWTDRETGGKTGKGVRFSLPSFNRLPGAMKSRVIRHAMNRVGGTLRKVDAGHVEAVRRLAAAPRPQARIDLPNRVVARREYGQLVFEPSGRGIYGDFAYAVEGPGSYDLEAVGRSVSLEFEANGSLPGNAGSPWTALLNGDLIRFPLTIRNFRPGDRFVPFGMKGRKKIKDFFIERKIPDSERRNVPLLTQGPEILWVCGLRIDDRFKMTEGAGKGLRVTFFPGGRGSLSPEAAE